VTDAPARSKIVWDSQKSFRPYHVRRCASSTLRLLPGYRVMSASLVYLLLRQVLQMLTQLARDGDAKEVTSRGVVNRPGESADSDVPRFWWSRVGGLHATVWVMGLSFSYSTGVSMPRARVDGSVRS
jgi:hypothetical protein